jgi:hypothetical protein
MGGHGDWSGGGMGGSGILGPLTINKKTRAGRLARWRDTRALMGGGGDVGHPVPGPVVVLLVTAHISSSISCEGAPVDKTSPFQMNQA